MTDLLAQVCVRVLVPFSADTDADKSDQVLVAAEAAKVAADGASVIEQRKAEIAVQERTQELVEVKRSDAAKHAEIAVADLVTKQIAGLGEITELTVEEVRER